MLAGQTLNVFLLTGISHINIFFIKKATNVVVVNVCPFPGADQNHTLALLLPSYFRLRMIFSMVVIAPHGEVGKAFPVVRLATHKLLV